ncbi:hypothetical protein PMIT1313_01071 [Prochlorococcus marinus str. MIT 1313]|uniref:DUF1254 domain-containing protein n=1 Tax=Prochlorococcus TaxID=1218 RepID=UPI0007B38CF4|nr:DUF1254 domain-containing protein [Prochlorococcus marinus]KZR69961.1 hypothetical protein PMIT1313_01071 [Prochlorococcus marinus str. MIT 1313]KZR72309.1 hypothetical protein PMIT1318_01369 [Prochlorococcus marinus str. MIT 1318]
MKLFKTSLASAILLASACLAVQAQDLKANGYNTPIPEDVLTPNRVRTRLGLFNYFDGFPDDETMRLARRQVDLGRGVQTFLNFMPAASLEMLYVGHRDGYGMKPNQDIGIFDELMSSKSLWLTGNTDTVYASTFLDLSSGPIIVEVPPGTGPGTVNDAFFRFVVDMGGPGPDKGMGGKYLILGPGQEAPATTDGFFVAKTPSYINWLILRGFLDEEGKTDTARDSFKNGLKVYPYTMRANPQANNFKNLTDWTVNTIHANNFKFYEELNEVIQREPSEMFSPELLGMASAIGIQKGKPFAPDAEQKALLTEAVAIGNATARSILFSPQDPKAYIYPNRSGYWQTGFPGGSHEYLVNKGNGGRDMDGRTLFFYLATVNTPAMALELPGVGSQYAFSSRDSNGAYLDGANTYKLTVPANAPANRFWSFVVYDPQTRSMLQSKESPYPSKNNKRNQEMLVNDDGSIDLYFGPKAPEGKKANWIKTIPSKGWFGILRLYGPLDPWFNQTWKLGAIKKMN